MLHFQHFSEINTIKPFVCPVRSFVRLCSCYAIAKPTTTMQSKYFVSTLWAGVLGIELTVRCSVKLAFRLWDREGKKPVAKAVDKISNKQTKNKKIYNERYVVSARDDGRCLTRIETRNYAQHFLKVFPNANELPKMFDYMFKFLSLLSYSRSHFPSAWFQSCTYSFRHTQFPITPSRCYCCCCRCCCCVHE